MACIESKILPKRLKWFPVGLILLHFAQARSIINGAALLGPNPAHSLVSDYAKLLLESLPKHAVLLSSTDINWNTVRYLQICEGKRPDVTHLSLQLMPYPWFQRQHSLYPVNFPPISTNVNTNKASRENQELILSFLRANGQKKVFIDLHAVK